MKNIAVLVGGPGSEKKISLITGQQCHKVLIDLGYHSTIIEVDQNIAAKLEKTRPDICFNAMHGKWGEDGCIAGLLNILNIPYTHSGVMASSIGMDKLVTKKILQSEDIRFPTSKKTNKAKLISGDPLPRPYIVKPSNEGSSLNIYIINNKYSTPPFTIENIPFSDTQEVMAEDYIPGRELTVGIIDTAKHGLKALTVSQMDTDFEFHSFDSKYTQNGSQRILPAPLPTKVFEQAQEWALKAHKALSCRGASRSDFRFDDQANRLYMLEINTHPGLTPTSMYPEQAAFCGISFPDLISGLVESARCDQ